MTYDILITTLNKTKHQILSLLNKNNIFGNILVGNQGNSIFSEENIIDKNRVIRIFNLTSNGVSTNRNFLLKQSKSDYVIFLDDDVTISNYGFNAESFDGKNAYRFNLVSNNEERPIKQIMKQKKLKFNDLKSFGVWGVFFPRKILLENNFIFNEFIGPGRKINHGEDSLFLFQYIQKNPIIQFNRCCFEVDQSASTWRGETRNITNELISHGFLYGIMFGRKAKLFLFYHLIKNRESYKELSLVKSFKISKKGIKLFINSKKTGLSEELINQFLG